MSPLATRPPATPPPVRPGSLRAWILAARPATLTAAVVPVAVGTACASFVGRYEPVPALACFVGAMLLQIGANFANDVFDYEKGADTKERLGPVRAVAAGLLSAAAVRKAMYVTFALALLVGVYLTAVAGPVIVAIGLLSIASAVAYTGGPYPLGYHGLGDVFVMLFFGFVAVTGTTYVQAGEIPGISWLAALPVGALATAILVVNNVRDRETDERAGKRTLAVRLGRRGAILEYDLLLAIAYLTPLVLFALRWAPATVLLPVVTLPRAVYLAWQINKRQGAALNPLLINTAQLLLTFGLAFAAGIALGKLEPAA